MLQPILAELPLAKKCQKQINACPVSIYLYFIGNTLEKITLKEGKWFSLFFIDTIPSKPCCKENKEFFLHWFAMYLQGKHLPFSSLPSTKFTSFTTQVHAYLQSIPFGKTKTYGEVARNLKNPKGARAVGKACGLNLFPPIIPCHRVIKKGKTLENALGGFAFGLQVKKSLLDFELTLCKARNSHTESFESQ